MTVKLPMLAARCVDIPVPPPPLIGVFFLIADGEVIHVGHSIDVVDRVRGLARRRRYAFDRVLFIPVPKKLRCIYVGAFARALRPRLTTRFSRDTRFDAEVCRQLGQPQSGAE